MKRYLVLLLMMAGFLSQPVLAMNCGMPVSDIVMADSGGDEEEEEPDCE